MKTVIFTDLDGTLLHPETYSFEAARPALELIRRRKIPLVLCSSKTRAELEVLRRRLQNEHPCISENGGGVFVPADYFAVPPEAERINDVFVASLGIPYDKIRKEFMELRAGLGITVTGFGDMTEEQVAGLTGLPREEAALARLRNYSEPFVFEQGGEEDRFLRAIGERGLTWTRGRLYCLMGGHDKGKAVRILKKWYEKEYGKITTIALGDALNDLSLLQEADYPVLVPKRDGTYEPGLEVRRLIRAPEFGPAGWNISVLELLK